MFSRNGIKAILFDLDGTIRIHLPAGGEVFSDFASSLGLPISDDDRLRAARWEHYYFASSPEILSDQDAFKEDNEAFWTNFGRRRLIALGCAAGQATELAAALSSYMRDGYRPTVHVPEDARRLLPTLRAAGYVLGVVSNRQKPYQAELEELGLSIHLDFSLAGGEVPAFKPQPEIFERALELAGSGAGETVYIGDNYFADVVGARRAGLLPVLYDPIRLFPDADCAVIRSFDELPAILKML